MDLHGLNKLQVKKSIATSPNDGKKDYEDFELLRERHSCRF